MKKMLSCSIVILALFMSACLFIGAPDSNSINNEENNSNNLKTNNNTTTPGICGDGIVGGSEECDGTDLNGASCDVNGRLSCNADCTFNRTQCASEYCIDTPEFLRCGIDTLSSKSCESEGFDGGTLSCNDCEIDTSQCFRCGNEKIEDDELCDGSNLGERTCQTEGYQNGEISCTDTCKISTEECEGTLYSQLSVGTKHSCALTMQGFAKCWGKDSDETDKVSNAVSNTPTTTAFSKVVAGRNHSCGLAMDGSVLCWGRLITDIETRRGPYKDLSAGNAFTCALTPESNAECWKIGAPVELRSADLATIESDATWTCGIDLNGNAQCWGDGNYPDIPQDIEFKRLSVGFLSVCGILSADGSIKCWSKVEITQSQVDGKRPLNGIYDAISVSSNYACAVRDDGVPKCWGYAGAGTGRTEPPDGELFKSIQTGATHACGIKTDGTIVCWGDSDDERLDVP